MTPWGILSEVGWDMNEFPSADHLSSSGCMCPGNFGSAGKRLGGKMRKGKVSLRPCLSQAASPIPMTKNSYLSAAITLTASTPIESAAPWSRGRNSRPRSWVLEPLAQTA